MTIQTPQHVPIMTDEVVDWLRPRSGDVVVDGTLGGGGHTRRLAECVGTDGVVIALDRDPAAVELAERTLSGLPVKIVQSNYCDLPEILEQLEITAIAGVVLDLGVSSDQLADQNRGFSFDSDGPLDLRFNPREGEPAWRLLGRLKADTLADLIHEHGEERYSRRIAREIVQRRQKEPIRTADSLAAIVRRCVPRTTRRGGIDPATRTFQALRIAVNNELKSLEIVLRRIPACLRPGGRMAVLSYHSLEDRRVKHAFRDDTRLEALVKKPVLPSTEEINRNPRARSAKLRVAERIASE